MLYSSGNDSNNTRLSEYSWSLYNNVRVSLRIRVGLLDHG